MLAQQPGTQAKAKATSAKGSRRAWRKLAKGETQVSEWGSSLPWAWGARQKPGLGTFTSTEPLALGHCRHHR
jgi:hypothetical protein